jgi:hypothetical protein
VKSKKSRAKYPISLRASEEDLKMLEWLQARTGLTNSALFKLALRRLYEKEGGQLSKDRK